MLRDDYVIHLSLEEIEVGDRRPVDPSEVRKLASSIREVGLQHPITVRRAGDRNILVAGGHRLEAVKSLGKSSIPCHVVRWSKDRARMWEISENLHRAELTKLERAEQIEEWRELKAKQVREVSAPSAQPTDKGFRKTAADLGVDEKEVRDSEKVASLSQEAKDAARAVGIDDNRSALLRVAKETTPEAQVRAVKLAADPKNDLEVKEGQVAALMAAWNRAGQDAREEFLLRIDRPVMDSRYGDAA